MFRHSPDIDPKIAWPSNDNPVWCMDDREVGGGGGNEHMMSRAGERSRRLRTCQIEGRRPSSSASEALSCSLNRISGFYDEHGDCCRGTECLRGAAKNNNMALASTCITLDPLSAPRSNTLGPIFSQSREHAAGCTRCPASPAAESGWPLDRAGRDFVPCTSQALFQRPGSDWFF